MRCNAELIAGYYYTSFYSTEPLKTCQISLFFSANGQNGYMLSAKCEQKLALVSTKCYWLDMQVTFLGAGYNINVSIFYHIYLLIPISLSRNA